MRYKYLRVSFDSPSYKYMAATAHLMCLVRFIIGISLIPCVLQAHASAEINLT